MQFVPHNTRVYVASEEVGVRRRTLFDIALFPMGVTVVATVTVSVGSCKK